MRPAEARRGRGEQGVALAIALAFLALFGVFTGVLLGFAEGNVRSTMALRDQTQRLYAIGGAIDGAINEIRDDILFGRDPATSPVPCPTNSYTAGGVTVAVACQGEPGSGSSTSGGPVPDYAVLSLGSNPAEHGFEQVSTTGVTVNGSVFSHSDVLNSGGASVMTVQGDLDAIGDCTATPPAQIVATGNKRCANEPVQADPANGPDPGYSPVTASVPPVRTVPPCSTNAVIELQPGTYTDAEALSELTDGSCSGAVVHLLPGASGVGAYYFDFRNVGSHAWVISDPTVNVVGGTKKGWIDAGPGVRPIVPFPGACKVEGDAAPNDGLQLLFGGDSRMHVDGAKVELCPQPSATQQEIVIYGVTSGSATPVTRTVRYALAVSGQFSNASNVLAIEGAPSPATADATLTLLESAATLAASGPSGIPAGSYVSSAKLRIAHDEGANAAAMGTYVVNATLHTAVQSVAVTPSTTYTQDEIALPGLVGVVGSSATAAAFLQVSRRAGLTDPTVKIDGLELEVTYEPPAFRAQSGCITQQPYVSGSASTCAVLSAAGTAGLAVQGTVYAPLAPIDVEVVNVSAQIFNRGIVARAVRLGIAPVAGYAGAPVGILRADRVVSFTGSAGATTIVSRATFEDGGGLTPGLTVTIDRWTVRR